MKYLFTLLLGLSFFAQLPAQTPELNRFMQKHKAGKENIKVSVPGWMLRLGNGIIRKRAGNDPLVHEALRLSRKIKKIKFLVVEDQNPNLGDDLDRMMEQLHSRRSFDDLVKIKAEGTDIYFGGKIKRGKIKSLVFLASSDDELFLFSMKSKLKISDLSDLFKAAIRQSEKQDRDSDPEDKEERRVIIRA